jgi:hypothetical protein
MTSGRKGASAPFCFLASAEGRQSLQVAGLQRTPAEIPIASPAGEERCARTAWSLFLLVASGSL